MWAWQEAKRKKKKRNKAKYPSAAFDQDEKAGWLLFIERSFAFVFGLLVGGLVLGGFGYFIGFLAMDDDGAAIGGIIGLVLALPFAIMMAGNISRYRL